MLTSTLSLMAAILLFLLFLSPSSVTTAQPENYNISIGDSLSPSYSTSWHSPSGFFAFGLYNESGGFRVGIWLETTPTRTIVWTANRDKPPVSTDARIILTDGGLAMLTDGAQRIFLSLQFSPGSCSSASMLDSGNFVLYNGDYKIIWESFMFPTDTILGGQTLQSGGQLFSSVSETDHSTGRFRLVMQSDPNQLVLYPANATDEIWNWQKSAPGELLHLYEDGSLYFVNSTNDYTSTSNTTFIYRATLDIDGIFRKYGHDFSRKDLLPMAKNDVTHLDNACEVKGFCGFNSYCTLDNNKPICKCIPGFQFIDPDRWFDGCHGNFTVQGCTDDDMGITYSIETFEDVGFIYHAYAVFSSVDKDGCREDCLNDCYCGAAKFLDNQCNKLNLPLLYGRNMSGSSHVGTTFVKLVSLNPRSSNVGNNTNIQNFLGIKNHVILMVVIGLAICLIAVSSFSVFLIFTNRAHRCRNMLGGGSHVLLEETVLRSFSYNELIEATDNFKEELGTGGFGTVYKGSLCGGPSGDREVAVKSLNEAMIEDGERDIAETQFRAEMRAIGRTHHKNLVRLLGFCDEGSNRLLVYEYMCNGSLAKLLFQAPNKPNWSKRVRIALDVAQGIFYLHEDCDPRIIHFDIKPQNILMDNSGTAKISDFGLAKLLKLDQTRTAITKARGTRGYAAPEWDKNTHITTKADVYSFGVVLLEIICCRRNREFKVEDGPDEIVLSEWVYKCFKGGELKKLIGDEEVERKSLDRMVRVGLLCVQEEPANRPTIKEVLLMMEGNMELPVPHSPTSSKCVS